MGWSNAGRMSDDGGWYKNVAAGGGFTPAFLTGLKGWWKADAGVFSDAGVTPATNGGNVQQWNDQSGNSQHFIQLTGANKPTYNTNTLNSLPVVTSAGSAFMDVATFAFSGTTVSVFLVVQATAGGGSRAICYFTGADTAGDAFLAPFFNSLTNPADFSLGGIVSNGTVVSGSWNEIGSIWDGVNNTMYIGNAAQGAVANAPTFATNGDLRIFTSSNGANLMTGSIAEIIVTNGALNSTDRGNVHTYFNSKWGV